MEVSNHIKAKWSVRGNYKRSVLDAWDNGIEVRMPNYTYTSARHDPGTETIFLSNGDEISTVINRYPHTEIIPIEEVECRDCCRTFQGRRDCPSCGSEYWGVC